MDTTESETTEMERVEAAARLARAAVTPGEPCLVGVRVDLPDEAPMVLALGESLGAGTRAGAVMARLNTRGGREPWTVVGIRAPGKPTPKERDAANRVASAARLICLPFDAVVLVAGETRL